MKYVTFRCLLAFCVFEIVHAYNLQNQIMSARYEADRRIAHYVTPKMKKIQGLLDAAKGEKKYYCQDKFGDALNKLAIRQQISLNKCIYDGSMANNVQVAQACNEVDVVSLESAMDTIVHDIKKCIRKK